jgi:hypothetical protein
MHLFKLLIKIIALKINLFLDSMDQVKFIIGKKIARILAIN